MKLRFTFLPLVFVIALVACGPSKTPDPKTETTISELPDPEGWEKRPYEISELVMMFQGWVPDQYLAGKFVWLGDNIEWEKYKQTDHTKIKDGAYNIVRGDSSMTPAVYMATIIFTIDDRNFYTPEGLKNLDAWKEEMLVGYSDIKCARLTARLVEEYINQDQLKPEFKVHKERWLKELNRIAEEKDK